MRPLYIILLTNNINDKYINECKRGLIKTMVYITLFVEKNGLCKNH